MRLDSAKLDAICDATVRLADRFDALVCRRADAAGDDKDKKAGGDLEAQLVDLKGQLRDSITQGHENIVSNLRKDIKELEERIEAKGEVGLGGERGDAEKRTFTPEQIKSSEEAVERAKVAYQKTIVNSVASGQSKARKKELEEAERWLAKVRKASA
jgi:hypothetical protein